MTSHITGQISEILKDDTRSAAARIEALLKLREDARALQRAATESPMGNDDAADSGLREIDRALAKLGHRDNAQKDENSAATL
ncbi:hypothetical protein [Roseibium sediminicola]|uniref:Uncharacterized protein n=1 Tax=Roseibium sediminicola TaxID=2933272 RepID=A0ABT0GUG9_9HYPH|nr:hypothetical protein [Roseibium sp. CAU 1639]MCK7612505.1 hypothetical protein [Roseibium sp. CAU 1639]